MNLLTGGKRAVVLFVSLSLVACSSTTIIRTNDPQAKIYIDGEFRGRGEAVESNARIVGSHTTVKIKRKGCEAQYHSFARNEEVDVGAMVGGFFLLFPLLWILKYKPEHLYPYECVPVI